MGIRANSPQETLTPHTPTRETGTGQWEAQPNNHMGLDITAYKNLTEFPCVFDADGEPIGAPEKHCSLTVNSDFSERADGMKDAIYIYEDVHSFRAGSYSGYNQWREDLAKLAGYPVADSYRGRRHDQGAWNATEGPFWELIHMSDCEGVIGPVTSAKLAKDFAEFQERANAFGGDYWRERYALWREAFEMAAQNGAVDFH